MTYSHSVGGTTWRFDDLREVMAKASPARSGDLLAGVAAGSDAERVAAQMCLADVPLRRFLEEALIPYERDEVTRLIIDSHDAAAFAPISHLTVGDFRNWLLGEEADESSLKALAPGLTPEMVAAVSKIMRVQDLILVAQKVRVVTRFRNSIGLAGRMSTRLQPNHPTDDGAGIAASIVDGLLYGNGDAVIGINPATDSTAGICELLKMLDAVISRYEIPTQGCILTHVTTSIEAINRGAPLDLVSSPSPAPRRPTPASASTWQRCRKATRPACRRSAAPSATTSCISRPARAARSRPTPITASISRPAKPAPTPSRAATSRCW